MDKNTGEIVTFDDIKEMEEFFNNGRNDNYVEVNRKNLKEKELLNRKVDSANVKNILVKIAESRNAPRGVRRRLLKQLYKLRKKEMRQW